MKFLVTTSTTTELSTSTTKAISISTTSGTTQAVEQADTPLIMICYIIGSLISTTGEC